MTVQYSTVHDVISNSTAIFFRNLPARIKFRTFCTIFSVPNNSEEVHSEWHYIQYYIYPTYICSQFEAEQGNINRIHIFCRFYSYSWFHLNLSRMITIEQLRVCLFSLLKRNRYLDKCIGDESLLSILHTQCYLLELGKAYLNQHILKI